MKLSLSRSLALSLCILLTGFGRAEAQTTVVSVPTVSALHTTTSFPTGTNAVIVENFAAAGDRGGGLFLLDNSLTPQPADGCISIADAVTPVHNHWVRQLSNATLSVLQCGAVADNSTDNTSAFNNAIAALLANFGGGTLYLPASFNTTTQTANCYVTTGQVNLPPYTSSFGSAWNEHNPFRVIGDGPVQTCWQFTPPTPSLGSTNAGLFALAQRNINMTTRRDQNAGIEIANISFVGPKNFNDSSCAIGVDNVTAPYIHDNWFQGWVGDPNANGVSGNTVNGNNIGGCAIEVYGYTVGGSFGANIDRNRFGFQQFGTVGAYTIFNTGVMAQTAVRYGIWLNGPYSQQGKVNDLNMTANRFEGYLAGAVRIEGADRPLWNAAYLGSSQDITSEKNKYLGYVSHSMERATLASGINPTDITLATISPLPPLPPVPSGSGLAGLVARVQMSSGVWEGAYIAASGSAAMTREVLLFSASGAAGTGSSSTAITLQAGSSASDGFYIGATMVMTSGACKGKSATVTKYVGSSTVATVAFAGCSVVATDGYTITPAWVTGPLIASGALNGIPMAGVVTLPAGSSGIDSYYVNDTMTMTSGTCIGDVGAITNYVGATLAATVSFPACSPGSTDAFTITPTQAVGTVFPTNDALASSPAPTATTVKLASTASAAFGYYTNTIMTMLTGTCMGKSATIANYGVPALTATVSFPGCTPAGTNLYAITPPSNVSYGGALHSYTSPTAVLMTPSAMIDNYYTRDYMTMTSGSCNGKTAVITGYIGSTLAATVTFSGCTLAATDNYTITPSSPASYSGVISAPSSTTVTLAVGASWANNFYTNSVMTMTSGTCFVMGVGDTGTITNYAGVTLVATVSFANTAGTACTPSAGDTYTITPSWWVAPVTVGGTATGGSPSSIVLQSGSSSVNGFYNNAILAVTGGSCMNDSSPISNYVGGSMLVATVSLGCTPDNTSVYTINSNYELGYADFSARAEWPHPMALGHAFYYAQGGFKFHSRGDYFENSLELVAGGSNTACVLASAPIYCNPPNAQPVVEFTEPENEVARGRSMLYEDESFFMPMNMQSVDPASSGQVGTNAVLGSLTLADPRLFSSPAPLMTLCLNSTGHALNVGDVVSLEANGGGANYNNCVDPATYIAGTGGSGTPVEFHCFIVTAPAAALVTSFPNGQPVTIALSGSQVSAMITYTLANPVNSGALLLPAAPNAALGINGSLTPVDPALATLQQVAQACGYAIGTASTTGGTTKFTLLKVGVGR